MVPTRLPDPFGGLTVALTELRNNADRTLRHHRLTSPPVRRVPPGGTLVGMTGYAGNKDQVLARLKRVEGQVRGIARMVEDDTYCIDVLTQVSAATKALQAVALGLLDDHLGHCVRDAVASSADDDGAAAEAKIAEASAAIARLVRS
jgi:DNA-binding FrmR family transcriptional regulator